MLKGFVANKWSFFKGERLHRAWLFVRLSWGNTGGLSSVTGWTWSVTCISVLSLSTEGGVYPWPVWAKEQEKYPSCMFILRAIILVYWRCVNTWVYQVYFFLNLEKVEQLRQNLKFIKTTAGILYLHHLWCMTWIQHVLHERRIEEKKQTAHCAIIQHRSGQVVQVSFSAETPAKKLHFTGQVCTCAFPPWIRFSWFEY